MNDDVDRRTVHLFGRTLNRDDMQDVARSLGKTAEQFDVMWEELQAAKAERELNEGRH